MNYRRTLGQYIKTNVQTAGRMDLVIMCYERIIQSLKEAKNYFQDEQFEKKGQVFQNALDIIDELRCSLDYEKGGQIADNLNAIYGYITGRLLQGNIDKDLTVFDEAIQIMSELKEAWDQIVSGCMDNIPSIAVPDSIKKQTTQIAA